MSKVVAEFYKGLLLKEFLRPDLYVSWSNKAVSGEMVDYILTHILPYKLQDNNTIYDTESKLKVQHEFKGLSGGAQLSEAGAENLLREREFHPHMVLVRGSSPVMVLLNKFMVVLSAIADWTGVQTIDLHDVNTAALILLVDVKNKSVVLIGKDHLLDPSMKNDIYEAFVSNGLFISDPVLSKLSFILLNILSDDSVAFKVFAK